MDGGDCITSLANAVDNYSVSVCYVPEHRNTTTRRFTQTLYYTVDLVLLCRTSTFISLTLLTHNSYSRRYYESQNLVISGAHASLSYSLCTENYRLIDLAY